MDASEPRAEPVMYSVVALQDASFRLSSRDARSACEAGCAAQAKHKAFGSDGAFTQGASQKRHLIVADNARRGQRGAHAVALSSRGTVTGESDNHTGPEAGQRHTPSLCFGLG